MLPSLSLMPERITKTPSASPISPPHSSELSSFKRGFVRSFIGSSFQPPRSPDAAQRVALRGAVRCRAGAVTNAGAWYGPGSAQQREERCTASGTRLHRIARRFARHAVKRVEQFFAPRINRIVLLEQLERTDH